MTLRKISVTDARWLRDCLDDLDAKHIMVLALTVWRTRELTGDIYLPTGKELVRMTEQRYDSEDILQTRLAEYPQVLGGDRSLAL